MGELTEKELRARAQAFYDVEEKLKYEYDGSYDQSSISAFFDEKANEILSKLDT